MGKIVYENVCLLTEDKKSAVFPLLEIEKEEYHDHVLNVCHAAVTVCLAGENAFEPVPNTCLKKEKNKKYEQALVKAFIRAAKHAQLSVGHKIKMVYGDGTTYKIVSLNPKNKKGLIQTEGGEKAFILKAIKE